MCAKCKKNIAVVFITKMENGATMNEGYCLKCARSLGIPQIDQTIKQMGISEDELDLLSDEMSSMFGQRENEDQEEDEIDSQTATFPLLNQLFGGNTNLPAQPPKPPKQEEPQEEKKGKKKNPKHLEVMEYMDPLIMAKIEAGKLQDEDLKYSIKKYLNSIKNKQEVN